MPPKRERQDDPFEAEHSENAKKLRSENHPSGDQDMSDAPEVTITSLIQISEQMMDLDVHHETIVRHQNLYYDPAKCTLNIFIELLFYKVLHFHTLLSLARTSKKMFQILKFFIESSFVFTWDCRKHTRFVVYDPQYLKIIEMTNYCVLPVSVIWIKVFNNDIYAGRRIPVGCKYFHTDGNFNRTIAHLPHTIQHISLPENFRASIRKIPTDVVWFSISDMQYGDIMNVFDLECDKMNNYSLFRINASFDNIFNFNEHVHMTHLVLAGNFNQRVDNLPPNLTHLLLGQCFNQTLTKLPISLKYLVLGNHFGQDLSSLPPGITHLVLGNMYWRGLENLPESLMFLSIGSIRYYCLDRLPASLIHLDAGRNEYVLLNFDRIPNSVMYLRLNRKHLAIQSIGERFLPIDDDQNTIFYKRI